jgi:FKBP-type peptidyl-prolyl cis-trans isomerase
VALIIPITTGNATSNNLPLQFNVNIGVFLLFLTGITFLQTSKNKMRKAFFFLAFTFVHFIANSQLNADPKYTAAPGGAEYIIFPAANGVKLTPGSFFQMQIVQFYRGATDTVLYDSRNNTSVIQSLDTANIPDYIYAALKDAKKNDSIVVRILVDSVIKKAEMAMPPFLEKGHFLYYCVKIENVFDSKEKADQAAVEARSNMAKKDSLNAVLQMKKDNESLEGYFKSKGIKPIKAPMGTFIDILKKGTGKNASGKDIIKVNYTGKTLAGKVFDSNTDKAFGHTDPYAVNLSEKGNVIAGWDEGLLYLNKGAKAVLYIPSPLAWGTSGSGADIGPNDIVVFDIEVVSIVPAANPPKPVNKQVIKPSANKAKTPIKPKNKKTGK